MPDVPLSRVNEGEINELEGMVKQNRREIRILLVTQVIIAVRAAPSAFETIWSLLTAIL